MQPHHAYRSILALALLLGAAAGGAQLLPQNPLGPVVGDIGRVGSDALGAVQPPLDTVTGNVRALAEGRIVRLNTLVRAHRDLLEMTSLGPAVRGEIVAADPPPAAVQAAVASGFKLIGEEQIEGLGIHLVRLAAPAGTSADDAIRRLARIAPGVEFSPDHLHFLSGTASAAAADAALADGGSGRPLIGIIDGGVAAHPVIGPVEQHGFAEGAPSPSRHGTAVASLAAGTGPMRSAAPGAAMLVADIYGRDPRGGNAVAIARALGLMVQRGVQVVNMSIVGPPNPLVAKAIALVRSKGVTIVAPVGNDGPAAPPAYPASYPGVISVTGVDGRNRPLIEASKALHLDFAAPAADMAAASPDGQLKAVRGTSFAAPLVAGRLARESLAALGAEAEDLGPKGPDKSFGRGLVCGACRTPVPRK
jgi:minor extracellular protease Epr